MPRSLVAALVLAACAPQARTAPTTPTDTPAPGEAAAPGPREATATAPANAARSTELVVVDAPGGGPLRRARTRARAPFGGAKAGFTWWASADGRLVALYRFRGEPRFGHHGEPIGDPPTLTIFDTVAGTADDVDEWIADDGAGRRAVVRVGKELRLLDGATGAQESLKPLHPDLERDRNRCLSPREATFDPIDGRLIFLRRGPDRAVILDLEDRREVEVPAGPGRLWRVEPSARRGWLHMLEIPADSDGRSGIAFPTQETSCACRWCGRFAFSYSTWGWSGDEFKVALAGPKGARVDLEGWYFPVGDAAVSDGKRALLRLDGAPVPIPEGCTIDALLDGADAALLRCGDESALLWPEDGRVARLPGRTTPIHREAVGDGDGRRWFAVTVEVDGRTRLGRLTTAAPRLELGPEVVKATRAPFDRVVARTAGGVAVYDARSGRSYVAAAAQAKIGQGGIFSGDVWLVDAERGAYAKVKVLDNAYETRSGCRIEAARPGTLEHGPWQVRCVDG
ncbi:MAG: hypothetical protein R3B09_26980 [Nannocystaceae bacterium]